VIYDDIQVGPTLKLSLPVAKCRQWNDDKEWASNPILKDVIKKRYALYRLAKPHFIRQYTVLPANIYTTLRKLNCNQLTEYLLYDY